MSDAAKEEARFEAFFWLYQAKHLRLQAEEMHRMADEAMADARMMMDRYRDLYGEEL